MCRALLLQENNKKKGAVTIIIALLLSSMLLIISLGVSTLIFQQLKMSGQAGRSVAAFYAADVGAETCLYDVYRSTGSGCDVPGGGMISGSLDADITYTAEYNGADIIWSIGNYLDTSRSLELTW